MHKVGPDAPKALAELRTQAFALLCALIKSAWDKHKTLVGFAMNHGSHAIDVACSWHRHDMGKRSTSFIFTAHPTFFLKTAPFDLVRGTHTNFAGNCPRKEVFR